MSEEYYWDFIDIETGRTVHRSPVKSPPYEIDEKVSLGRTAAPTGRQVANPDLMLKKTL